MPNTFQTDIHFQSQQYFDQKSSDFNHKYSHHPSFKERYQIWSEYIQRYTQNHNKQTLCLDIGCGPGVITTLVSSHGIRTVGIDQSTSMLELATSSIQQQGLDSLTKFLCASVPLPLELETQYTNSADLIVCSSVLEYIADWQTALRQFHLLLEPNGILLISLPNRDSIYRAFERGLKKTPLSNNLYIKYQHHQFDPGAINGQLQELGFSVIDKAFFALPFHNQLSGIFGTNRPEWLATMFLVAAQKSAIP